MSEKLLPVLKPAVSKTLFLFASLLFSHILLAQRITGTVSDQTGKALPAVTVQVKGSNNATTTDGSGQYSINAGSNATLVFSSVGFTTREIPVEGRSVVDISLV